MKKGRSHCHAAIPFSYLIKKQGTFILAPAAGCAVRQTGLEPVAYSNPNYFMKTIAVCAFTGADITARGRTIDYNAFFRFP